MFDSGVGGLTVVAALERQLPEESILYLGDTARLPYGTKSQSTIERYTRRNIEFLVARGVKAVVVACNTASALALPSLDIGLPCWGVVEPGARRAAALSGGRVGVIATESTIASGAYARALAGLRADLDVHSQPCPLFTPLVEEGWQDDPVAELVAARYLEPLRRAGIDTLVLGCTHYPILQPVLARLLGPAVERIDSGEAAAVEVAAGLAEAGLLAPPGSRPEHHFCVTDAAERFDRIAHRILGAQIDRLELVEVV